MYTVGQVARAVQISDSAVRQWADEYADHLSDGANPAKGETRLFDDGDVAVLQTVAVLRDQLVPHEQIHERIEQGERLEPAGDERPAAEGPEREGEGGRPAGPESPDTALVTESFAEALRRYDSQISGLQGRVEELTERLIEAEKRAAAAETRASMLQEQIDARSAGGSQNSEDEGRAWWRFWER